MSKRAVILLGYGGHGQVVADLIRACGLDLAGYAAPTPSLPNEHQNLEYLGPDTALSHYPPERFYLANGIGAVRDTRLRTRIFTDMSAKGYHFPPLIHPSAIIAPDVKIGDASQVQAGSVLQTGVIIGRNSIINTRASIDHNCKIGDHVHIAPGAVLSGDVQIGDSACIGTGAVIIQSIRIGASSLIGAGAAVVCDIPPNSLAVGTPARIRQE